MERKTRRRAGTILCLCAAALFCIVFGTLAVAQEKDAGKKAKPGGAVLSGPYTHKNLTVFLIHGKDKIDGTRFLTLQEALEKKVVVVSETGNVQELSIENKDKEFHVYIQSGEIVKGGKQDRVLQYDLLLKPGSGKVPLKAFCVEQGRWSGRGNESAAVFNGAKRMVVSKDLKIAANSGNQNDVWRNVAKSQEKLSANAGESVNAPASRSSLQLSLENKKLNKMADEYKKAIEKATKGKKNVIGYAFAINGKMNSADVYASGVLFKKLWPKMLKASAVEAIAELKKGEKLKSVAAEDVKKFMENAEKGKAKAKQISRRVKMITRENEKGWLFETKDIHSGDTVIHKSYIKK